MYESSLVEEEVDNPQGKTLQEVVERTAYSLGAFLGDGHARYAPSRGNGSCYYTSISCMDLEIVLRFKREVEWLFGAQRRVRFRTLKSGVKLYTCTLYNHRAFQFFNVTTMWKTEVPIEVVRAGDEVKRDFLAGLFDTDGSVSESRTKNGGLRWQVKFSSTQRGVVESTASVLRSLGVKAGSISVYERGDYRTIFTICPNIRSFIDSGCYFEASRKGDRLLRYLAAMSASEIRHTAPLT